MRRHVIPFDVPASTLVLARRRTENIRREYAHRTATGFDDHPEMVAVSCYLQGVNDMAEILHRHGITIDKES